MLERNDKTFEILVNNRKLKVSIDRVKAAFIPAYDEVLEGKGLPPESNRSKKNQASLGQAIDMKTGQAISKPRRCVTFAE